MNEFLRPQVDRANPCGVDARLLDLPVAHSVISCHVDIVSEYFYKCCGCDGFNAPTVDC